MNKFMLNETSYHGAGAITAIPDEIKNRGFKKAFVTSDPDLVKFGIVKKVTDLLDNANIDIPSIPTSRLTPQLKMFSTVLKNLRQQAPTV